MEEMTDDMLDMEEDEELEEEADAEVDKILFDLTDGKLGQAGSVRTELPVCSASHQKSRNSDLFCRRNRSHWKTRRQSAQWSSIDSS
jgi:hypothetical protein